MIDIQEISLDIHDNKTYDYIYEKQYNKGTKLKFNITQDGTPFDLGEVNVSAVFQMKKPDNTVVIKDCTVDENTIEIEVTDQMTSSSGIGNYQIQLIDSNGVTISTITGKMKIEESTVQDGDISSNDYSLLEDAISSAEISIKLYEDIASTDVGIKHLLLPKGSDTFNNFKVNRESIAGYMYRISDAFTSDDSFIVSDINYPAGTNVYYYNKKWIPLNGDRGIKTVISDTEPSDMLVNDIWLQEHE